MPGNQDSTALTKSTGPSAPVSASPQPLIVSTRYIEETKQSLALLQEMVRDVLVEGRDYGSVEGIPGAFLWDPGASQIIGSFNCFAGHRRVLSLIDDGAKIAIVLEVPLIQRGTLQEVGSGIGASSTLETKHKYRWVSNPGDWGYTGEALKALRSRPGKDGGRTQYQIPNPEHDELLNVITKQASKRAEVDAAESLPGVASVLREMFGKTTASRVYSPESGPNFNKFWSEARAILPNSPDVRAEVHQLLGVKSMSDWTKSGKSLNDAIKILKASKDSKDNQKRRNPATVTEQELKTGINLQKVMFDCFGWQPKKVWAEANYSSMKAWEEEGTETAWQLFQRLRPVAIEQARLPDKE
jgi:hypothetical protein